MSLHANIIVPSAVSSLSFTSSDSVWAGSDDGTLRLYKLPSSKVVRAIRALNHEIASITPSTTAGDVWIASGRQAFCFPLHSDKIILSSEDAKYSLDLGEDDEDVLNELSVSQNQKYLAFSTDVGTAGVVELSTKSIIRMKTRHSNICGAVKFIPERPNELVSGGYDSALLHHEFNRGTYMSRLDIAAAMPSSGVSLSPPFVLSISLSPLGLIAVSTADGRVWLGGGGEKGPHGTGTRPKKSRKWEGLKEEEGIWLQVADGPVVSTSFFGTDSVLTCSLLGKLARYTVFRDADGKLKAESSWAAETKGIAKVNAMAVKGQWTCVGGVDNAGKGAIEVWAIMTTNGDSEPSDVLH